MRFFLILLFYTATVVHAQSLFERSTNPLQAESSPESLIPWETPIEGFFIRTHHPVPNIDPARWRLVIDGLVEKPLTLSLADLRRMRTKSLHAVLECSGNKRGLQTPSVSGIQWGRGAVGNAAWTGVSLRDLLARAGIKSDARFATLEGADKPAMPGVPAFVRSVPLDKILHPDSLLALQMNREPLPLLHGGPARVILPGWYAESWMKWVTRITLTREEDQGFYMRNAYRMPRSPLPIRAPWDSSTGISVDEILVQSLITEPVDQAHISNGTVHVRGKAFSGAGTITRVDVSSDNGRTWQQAMVTPQRKSKGWQEFSIDIEINASGPVTLWSRATDSRANAQPLEHTWNPGGYAHNSVDKVTFVAAESSLVASRCFSCHGEELVKSQRLNASQWDGVLKKMRTFGVNLDDETARLIKEELLALPPSSTNPKPTHYKDEAGALTALITGNTKHGKELYLRNCAVCHGASGQGQIGPRLARAISFGDFSKAIAHGKGLMPAFDKQLSQSNMRDMLAWLRSQ